MHLTHSGERTGRKLIAYLVICFASGFYTNAQELWTGGTVRMKHTSRLSSEFTQQLRLENETFHYNSTFSEIGLKYKLMKSFGVKGNYRFVFAPRDNRHRVTGDVFLNLGSDDRKFSSSIRLRYQKTSYFDPEKEDVNYIRSNFVLNYNLTKRAQPYASTELFYRLDQKNEMRLIRVTFGLISKFTDNLSFNTFYRIENELSVKRPERVHIVGLLLVYNLQLKKDKQADEIENNKEE